MLSLVYRGVFLKCVCHCSLGVVRHMMPFCAVICLLVLWLLACCPVWCMHCRMRVFLLVYGLHIALMLCSSLAWLWCVWLMLFLSGSMISRVRLLRWCFCVCWVYVMLSMPRFQWCGVS